MDDSTTNDFSECEEHTSIDHLKQFMASSEPHDVACGKKKGTLSRPTFVIPPLLQQELLFGLPQQVSVNQSGFFWYKPGNYMDWHTNANKLGIRLYVSIATKNDHSGFKYYDAEKDEVVDIADKTHWTCKLFNINKDTPLWHSVYAKDAHRLSLGFNINK